MFISGGDIDIQNATRLHHENSLEYGWLAMEKLIMIGSTYESVTKVSKNILGA